MSLPITLLLFLSLSFSPGPTGQQPTAEARVDETALPASGGTVFVVQAGSASASPTQLHASEIVSNSHAAANFARAQVFSGPHSTVELNGVSAQADFEVERLVFYVRLNGEDPDVLSSRLHLLRLQPTEKRRVVAKYSQNVWGGQHKKQYDDVAIRKEQLPGSTWLKLTPDQALAPGQYGIASMPQDQSLLPDTVYDFAVEAKR